MSRWARELRSCPYLLTAMISASSMRKNCCSSIMSAISARDDWLRLADLRFISFCTARHERFRHHMALQNETFDIQECTFCVPGCLIFPDLHRGYAEALMRAATSGLRQQ